MTRKEAIKDIQDNILPIVGGKSLMMAISALQQPEVIQCEDCEWWEKQKDSLQGRCELMQMYPTGAWYCGNAQRRVTDG